MPKWHDVNVAAPGPTGMASLFEIDGKPVQGVLSWSVEVASNDNIVVSVKFIANSLNTTPPAVTAPPVE